MENLIKMKEDYWKLSWDINVYNNLTGWFNKKRKAAYLWSIAYTSWYTHKHNAARKDTEKLVQAK